MDKIVTKLVLSNKLYFSSSDVEKIARIEQALTYQLNSSGISKAPVFVRRFGKVAKTTFWAPTGNIQLVKDLMESDEYVIVDKRAAVEAVIPKPTFSLRPDQQDIYDNFNDSCIINGKPGFGKTILALAIAHKMQLKTLVVCTTTAIRDQWVKEVEKHFGFTPGLIGSGKYETDAPIVISNIQTVRKYGVEIANMFGILIVDEAHHCCAATFTKIIDESRARYKIGLTGTLKRKDGLDATFTGYFSEKVFVPKVSNTLKPTIHAFSTKIGIPGNVTVPWALRINELVQNPAYRNLLVVLCNAYMDLGHKVLIVSDRVELLEYIEENIPNSYKIIGNSSTNALEERTAVMEKVAAGGPCVLGASISIFSEGISLNELSCLINATSTNNESLVEQLAGRIMRISEDKLDPVVVDIGLSGSTGTRHRSMRFGIYAQNDWPITHMDDQTLASLFGAS